MDEYAECWMVICYLDDVQSGPPRFFTKAEYDEWYKFMHTHVTMGVKVKLVVRKYEMSGFMIATRDDWEEDNA